MSPSAATKEKRNVAVLAALQGLLFTNNATAIAVNVLAGYALAPDKSLATLPVTSWVVGGALTTFFASLAMQRVGRRAGFAVGALAGLAGAGICCVALYVGSFWLFVLGTTVYGIYNAFGQYYRFAAADAATAAFRPRAISYVLAGGLAGGVVGPTLSNWTKDILPVAYLGAYLTLMALLVVVLAVVRLLDIPAPASKAARERGRPFAVIAAQPTFIVAVIGAAFGYGIMSLLMTATPLAMGVCGHPYSATAAVISAHVVSMFAPSFVTGDLIKRFGALNVMLCGVAFDIACVAVAVAGIQVAHFWWALVLAGVGWNFLYVGGTALLTETYRPAEQAKAQGANDLLIFVTTAVSSLFSGIILVQQGWAVLSYAAIPFAVGAGVAIVWLMMKRRRASAVA